MSKEERFIKDFDFLGFSRCFSVRIEQTSKKPPENDTKGAGKHGRNVPCSGLGTIYGVRHPKHTHTEPTLTTQPAATRLGLITKQ